MFENELQWLKQLWIQNYDALSTRESVLVIADVDGHLILVILDINRDFINTISTSDLCLDEDCYG